MPWFIRCLAAFCFGLMNGLSTEYINSCARELGAKRLRLELPWEKEPLDSIFSRKKSVVPKPEWIEFPVHPVDVCGDAPRPVRLDRYNS